MVDSGATSLFMDHEFALASGFGLRKKASPEKLTLADGRSSVAGNVVYESDITLQIDQHREETIFQITKISGYPAILGKAWLERHNPSIDWSKNQISFASSHCRQFCLPPSSPKSSFLSNLSLLALSQSVSPSVSQPIPTPSNAEVSFPALTHYAKRKKTQIFRVSIEDIENHLSVKEKTPEEEEQFLRSKIPTEFHDLLPLFRKGPAERIPPHRGPLDCPIEIEQGKHAPFGPLYAMSDLELRALREHLDSKLRKGYIQPSTSSCASPVLFVRKPGRGLRFCVDYRSLNNITKKNRTPLPLIDESLRQLSGAKVFSRLDLRYRFN